MAGIKPLFWKLLYSRWRQPRPEPVDGYSILVPVPGDLPVFLELALSVLKRQDSANRVETLVIPDVVNPRMREIVERERPGWTGDLRLIEMPLPDRWITSKLNKPHHNHWLQLINGATNARGRYALLHDADLFITTSDFLRKQFDACSAGSKACYGVHPVWDRWFAERGRHLSATWEMMFEIDWLRSFPPHLHLGHDDVLDGERHTFDTTLLPQCLTPANRIGFSNNDAGLIHFNYVICSYRYFRDARRPYVDDHFRILLIRLLSDLFAVGDNGILIPSLDDLTSGLRQSSGPVSYSSADANAHYPEFRSKLNLLLGSELVEPVRARALAGRLEAFDSHFAWSPSASFTSA